MSRNSKRICLVEFRLTGHHPLYLSYFAQSFQKLGYDVDIYSPDVSKCKEVLKQALPSLDLSNITLMHTDAATPNQKRIFGCRSFFHLIKLQREIEQQESTKEFSYELVFFAYLDDIVHVDFKLPYLLKTPFTKKFSGLLMAPRDRVLKKFPFPIDYFTTSLVERKYANFPELGLLVEDVQTEVETKILKKTVVYPDFCSQTPLEKVESPLTKELARRKKNRVVTSLLGSIVPHKSVDLLFDCMNNSNADKHFFIIAGKFHRPAFSNDQWELIQKVISNSPENLLVHDDWIESEAIFDTIVQMSDVLFAYYRGFKKSSNILSKGAFYKIPVIVSDKHLMGNRVHKFKLGFAISESLVVELYKQPEWENFKFDESRLKEFLYLHSVNRIPEIFSDLLDN